MRNNIPATTFSQSRQLVELGIDAQTADMRYAMLAPYEAGVWELQAGGVGPLLSRDHFKPAWSLSALLDVAKQLIGRQDLELRCNWNGKTWFAIEMAEQSAGCYEAENPIDAVFEMVCDHLKNEHGTKRNDFIIPVVDKETEEIFRRGGQNLKEGGQQ